MQFYLAEQAYIKFDYNIPRGASIGVYGRRNALPTHTQYHFKEVLSGFNARTTRSTHVSVVLRMNLIDREKRDQVAKFPLSLFPAALG